MWLFNKRKGTVVRGAAPVTIRSLGPAAGGPYVLVGRAGSIATLVTVKV
jgi:hypothetical protein